jgi:hypothetical protein
MIGQIFAGIITEGKTDNRFLESVTKRTFDVIGFECNGEIEIDVRFIPIEKTGLDFKEIVIKSAKKGLEEFGIVVLCIHTDADDETDARAFQTKINPAIDELNLKNDHEYCKTIVTIIPVQMIEAWMLADKNLFKREIGTDKSDNELGINRNPEIFADPKEVIKSAIRIAREDLTKRRRNDLTISELYLPLGQKISIQRLDTLPSFIKFKESIRNAFRALNYMQ